MTLPLSHNDAVRDLDWVLRGPGLLDPAHPRFSGRLISDEEGQAFAAEARDFFLRLDRDPRGLEEFLASKLEASARLGRYFEALIAYFVLEGLRPEMMRSGLVVRSHQTLGEFDFVFRGPGEIVAQHWEAAVKFFLSVAETETQARDSRYYVGTQTRDRLDLKVSRIFEHQLLLGATPEGRRSLQTIGVEQVRPRAWVKGMLFYPSNTDWRSGVCPEGVAATHSRGWWTTLGRSEIPQSDSQNRWLILPKRRWLSPAWIASERKLETMARAQMEDFCRDHFSRHMAALMLAELGPTENGDWQEIHRGLVVADPWPAAAREAVLR